jgi:hypothetical protein
MLDKFSPSLARSILELVGNGIESNALPVDSLADNILLLADPEVLECDISLLHEHHQIRAIAHELPFLQLTPGRHGNLGDWNASFPALLEALRKQQEAPLPRRAYGAVSLTKRLLAVHLEGRDL